MTSVFLNNFYYTYNLLLLNIRKKQLELSKIKEVKITFIKKPHHEDNKDIYIKDYLTSKFESEKLTKLKENSFSKEKMKKDLSRIKNSLFSVKDKVFSKFKKK